MSSSAPVAPFGNENFGAATSADRDSGGKFILLLMLSTMAASFVTAVSLAIAAYGAWQRGGAQVEQVINIALASIAVFYLHLSPTRWNAFRPLPRAFAFALWCVSLLVILYGQVTFFMVSQHHAGDQRAATVRATVPQTLAKPRGRSLTEVAQAIAKVTADLARVDTSRCEDGCPRLVSLRMTLLAQLSALNTEADEAKRREADEDRLNRQIDSNERLRMTLRADPVASAVAAWLGTTESRLELLLGVAYAVVLEGAAIIGWLLVPIASSRGSGREAQAFGRDTVMPKRETVASEPATVASRVDPTTGVYAERADDHVGLASSHALLDQSSFENRPASEDDLLLEKIHEAVLAERLKPTQAGIRTFLCCGQQRAGRLKRQYLARLANAGIR